MATAMTEPIAVVELHDELAVEEHTKHSVLRGVLVAMGIAAVAAAVVGVVLNRRR